MNKEDFVNNLRDLLSKYDRAQDYTESKTAKDKRFVDSLTDDNLVPSTMTDTNERADVRFKRILQEYFGGNDKSKLNDSSWRFGSMTSPEAMDPNSVFYERDTSKNKRQLAQDLNQKNWEDFKNERIRRLGVSADELAKYGLIANDDGSVEDIDYDYYAQFDNDTLRRVFGSDGAGHVISKLYKLGYR